jgi:hypothetical protein
MSATGAQEVSALFSRGRLTAIPRKAARREQLLAYLAQTLFAPDREYAEREINDALLTVHDDFPALRRYLVEGGWLTRHPDGSVYWRAW